MMLSIIFFSRCEHDGGSSANRHFLSGRWLGVFTGRYIYLHQLSPDRHYQIWRMVADGNGQTRPTFDVNFNDWVADLAPVLTQHVNHNTPWQLWPWVVTKEGHRSKPGEPLDCKTCDR